MIKSFRRWVFTFFRDFYLLFQSFRPFFFVSWWRERLKEHGSILVPSHVHWRVVKQKDVYQMHGNGYIPRELPCIWSCITLKLSISAHSKENKTLEYGNHYKVSFITLHTKASSPVHVQPLATLAPHSWQNSSPAIDQQNTNHESSEKCVLDAKGLNPLSTTRQMPKSK